MLIIRMRLSLQTQLIDYLPINIGAVKLEVALFKVLIVSNVFLSSEEAAARWTPPAVVLLRVPVLHVP